MRKQVLFLLISLLTGVVFSDAALSRQLVASAPQEAPSPDPALEKERMIEAAGKTMEVVMAQLDGDSAKLEHAVSEAVALYDQIVAANPANVKAINGRASVKEMQAEGSGADDFKKSIALMTAAVDANDQDADAYYNRAVAYRGLKQYTEARADYQKAIALDPAKTHWVTDLKAMEVMAK